MEQNYYEILEVDRKASKEIIKKAYTTLAKKYHPDVHSDSEKKLYEEKFKLINEAYETLSDNTKRAEYDRTLTDKIQVLENKIIELSRENELLKRRFQGTYSRPRSSTYTQANSNYSNYSGQQTNNNYSGYAGQQTNNNYSGYASQQTNNNYSNYSSQQANGNYSNYTGPQTRQYNRRNYRYTNLTFKDRIRNFFKFWIALFLTFCIISILLSKFPFVLHFISNVLFI